MVDECWLAEAERLLDLAQKAQWMHATAEAKDWDDWESWEHAATESRSALLAHLRAAPPLM